MKLGNGTELIVGRKYCEKDYFRFEYVTILDLGSLEYWVETDKGEKYSYQYTTLKLLPYKEPEKEIEELLILKQWNQKSVNQEINDKINEIIRKINVH